MIWCARSNAKNFRRLRAGFFAAALGVLALVPHALSAASVQDSEVRGNTAYAAGRIEDAIEAWTEGIDTGAANGFILDEARLRGRRADAYRRLGFRYRAAEDLERALHLATASGAGGLARRLTASLGALRFLQGDLGAAERLLRSVVDDMAAEPPAARATAMNDLGVVLAAGGRTDEAAALFDRALTLARNGRAAALAIDIQLNRARTAFDRGDKKGGDQRVAQAVAAIDNLPDARAKADRLLAAESLLHRYDTSTGSSGRRFRLLQKAELVARATDDSRALSLTLGAMARLYAQERRNSEALLLARAALAALPAGEADDLAYRWHWQIARLHAANGALADAVSAYDTAVTTARKIKGDLSAPIDGQPGSFRRAAGQLFYEAVDVILQLSGQENDTARRETLLRQARVTVEELKAVELQDYFQDQCVSELRRSQRGIDRLADETAVIYPIILESRLELLISVAGQLHQVTVSVDRQTFVERIRSFRRHLETRGTNRYRRDARALFDWIARPILPLLEQQGVDTIVFVPDGPLRTIPLGALYDRDTRQFLVERFAVAVAPGLTLTQPRRFADADVAVLVSGLTQSVQGYPPLPGVLGEVAHVRETFRGTALVDDQFLVHRFGEELQRTPWSVVHIASHGEFDSDHSKSFLLAYDDKLSMNRLEQFVKYGQFRKEPLELLVLSACQTAAGDDRAALGLAGVAIKAGARSALATLWFVNDEASSRLITNVYEQLKGGAPSKAKALQAAQTAMIQDRRFRHPSYWSPFLLIGNWL